MKNQRKQGKVRGRRSARQKGLPGRPERYKQKASQVLPQVQGKETMATVLICRTCGTRVGGTLATNEQDLANVGMLERSCVKCSSVTRWGLAQDYRMVERRATDRRNQQLPFSGPERRRIERRTGGDRRGRS
jgi:hypothetical protein